jgi:hypothetical protein
VRCSALGAAAASVFLGETRCAALEHNSIAGVAAAFDEATDAADFRSAQTSLASCWRRRRVAAFILWAEEQVGISLSASGELLPRRVVFERSKTRSGVSGEYGHRGVVLPSETVEEDAIDDFVADAEAVTGRDRLARIGCQRNAAARQSGLILSCTRSSTGWWQGEATDSRFLSCNLRLLRCGLFGTVSRLSERPGQKHEPDIY